MRSPRPAPFGHGAVLSHKIVKGGQLVKHGNCGTPIGILRSDPATGRINRFEFDRKWTSKRGVWQWTQHAVHASRHPQVIPPRGSDGVSPDYGWHHPGWVRPSLQWDAGVAPPPVVPAWCAVCKQPFRLDFGWLLLEVHARSRAVASAPARAQDVGGDIPF